MMSVMDAETRKPRAADAGNEEPVLLENVLQEEGLFEEIMRGSFCGGMSLDQAWEGMERMAGVKIPSKRPQAPRRREPGDPTWISVVVKPQEKQSAPGSGGWKPISHREIRQRKKSEEKARDVRVAVESPIKKRRPGKGRLVLFLLIVVALFFYVLFRDKGSGPLFPSPERPLPRAPEPPVDVPPDDDKGWRGRIITE